MNIAVYDSAILKRLHNFAIFDGFPVEGSTL